MATGTKINYARGFSLSASRLMLSWIFGKDLISVKANHANVCFDIMLKNPDSLEDKAEIQGLIDDFHEHFDAPYRFFFGNAM